MEENKKTIESQPCMECLAWEADYTQKKPPTLKFIFLYFALMTATSWFFIKFIYLFFQPLAFRGSIHEYSLSAHVIFTIFWGLLSAILLASFISSIRKRQKKDYLYLFHDQDDKFHCHDTMPTLWGDGHYYWNTKPNANNNMEDFRIDDPFLEIDRSHRQEHRIIYTADYVKKNANNRIWSISEKNGREIRLVNNFSKVNFMVSHPSIALGMIAKIYTPVKLEELLLNWQEENGKLQEQLNKKTREVADLVQNREHNEEVAKNKQAMIAAQLHFLVYRAALLIETIESSKNMMHSKIGEKLKIYLSNLLDTLPEVTEEQAKLLGQNETGGIEFARLDKEFSELENPLKDLTAKKQAA